jgi:hypothetical protein
MSIRVVSHGYCGPVPNTASKFRPVVRSLSDRIFDVRRYLLPLIQVDEVESINLDVFCVPEGVSCAAESTHYNQWTLVPNLVKTPE